MTGITGIKRKIDKIKSSLDSINNQIEDIKIVIDVEGDKGGTFIKYKGQNDYIKVVSNTMIKKVEKYLYNQGFNVEIVDDDGNPININDLVPNNW